MWNKTRYIPQTFIILNSKKVALRSVQPIFCYEKIFLLLVLLITALASRAELWTPVGQVQWTDGILGCRDSGWNASWTVSVERLNSRPGVFRLQPYLNHPTDEAKDDVYVYLHTENPKKVYIEVFVYCHIYYGNQAVGNKKYWVTQRCVENSQDSQYYGEIRNETTITFPVGSFLVEDRVVQHYVSRNSTSMHKIVFPEGVLLHFLQDIKIL